MPEITATIKYIGVATLINTNDDNKVNKFWVANWTLNAKLLSKSSWSLVALAIILPVGVTSNQLKGVCKRV